MPGDPAVQISTGADFARFRAFWREVEIVKADAARGAIAGPKAREHLLAVLRAQEAEVARASSAAAMKDYREVQYVMAAAADDAFVRFEWRGSEEWMMNPLETDLFGSRRAGQLVFDRIDQLVSGAHPTAQARAEIYLTALALGFEGRFAGLPDRAESLGAYRRTLQAFLTGGRPGASGPLVPQCYGSTQNVGTGRLLRTSRLWWWASAAIVAVWLIVSSMLWRELRSASGPASPGAAASAAGAPR